VIVTPEECVQSARQLGPDGELEFHPLVGGLDAALAGVADHQRPGKCRWPFRARKRGDSCIGYWQGCGFA
jgi:hypothetical protein